LSSSLQAALEQLQECKLQVQYYKDTIAGMTASHELEIASMIEEHDRDIEKHERSFASLTGEIEKSTVTHRETQDICSAYAKRLTSMQSEVVRLQKKIASLTPYVKRTTSRQVSSSRFAAIPLATSSEASSSDALKLPYAGEAAVAELQT